MSTYHDLEDLGVHHHLVAHIEVLNSVEMVIIRRWAWYPMATNKGPWGQNRKFNQSLTYECQLSMSVCNSFPSNAYGPVPVQRHIHVS